MNYISDLKKYVHLIFDDYDFLPDNVSNLVMLYIDNQECFTKFFKDINFEDFYYLMPGDIQDLYNKNKKIQKNISTTDEIYNDIMFVCKAFLKNNAYANNDKDENTYNDYFRDMLSKEYAPSDQTRQGKSYSEKSAGEVDIALYKNNSMVSIIETLKLNGVDKNRISEHITKVINYDTIGNAVNFVISYVNVSDFGLFWNKYKKYIKEYNYKYPVIKIDENSYEQYSELKTILIELNRNDVNTKLYHIAIHLQLSEK